MKKATWNNFSYSIVLIVTAIICLTGCDRDKNSPGYTYMPDMAYSRTYESYSENPNFKDNMTLRIPPAGTVPRGYTPLSYTKDTVDRIKAGIELKNPFDNTPENLSRGEVLFKRFCIHCHGSKGDGMGHLYTSKLYPFPPRSLINARVRALPDGQIFHTITYGFGIMGAHGSMILPEDRWKIVIYIKEVLQAENNGSSGIVGRK
jgi:mono/diheme cytochrome c family protein